RIRPEIQAAPIGPTGLTARPASPKLRTIRARGWRPETPRPMRGTPMRRPAHWLLAAAIAAAPTTYGPASAQEKGKDDIRELKLRDWEPRSMLASKVTEVARPAFPVVDVHNHLGGGKAILTPRRVEHYLEEMDAAGVRAAVNLDGGWGQRLK